MFLNSSNVHGRVTCNNCNFIYTNISNIMLIKLFVHVTCSYEHLIENINE